MRALLLALSLAAWASCASAEIVTVTTPSAGQTPGTATNDNANAGNVGQIIESTVLVGAAVSATTATNLDVTSISLTAGDWDVWGSILTNPNGATTTTAQIGWIHTVSATQPTAPNGGAYTTNGAALGAGAAGALSVGMKRLSLSSTTTVFLSAQIVFAINTNAVYGYIGARRVR